MVKRGEWVKIEKIILNPDERTAKIPEETKKVPYVVHILGHLLEDANLGENATIISRIGRIHEGKLIEEKPAFRHNFGDFVPQLVDISIELKKELEEINNMERRG